MKVLVTGATGFLGRNLIARLQQQECEITALGRNETIGRELTGDSPGERLCQRVKFIARDLRDREGIINDCRGQDIIFHCGALSAPWGRERDFYDINVGGTKHIIEGCQTHGVDRLIHVSTSAVYFDYRDRLNIPEDLPFPTPVNAYAHSKQLAETEIDRAFRSGVPVLTIRPRGIFGCGDTAILPRLLKANRRLGIPFIDGGRAIIDVTYVDNVVDALLLCQNAPEHLLGRVFNITNGEPISVAKLLTKLFDRLDEECRLRLISRGMAEGMAVLMEGLSRFSFREASPTILMGKEPILTRYTVGLLAYSQTLDISAATQELGYRSRVTLDDGLDIFARWHQQSIDR